jgi:hypothetical protein
MAIQNLIEQHMIFTAPSNQFDQNIASNVNIVQIANNCTNKTYYQMNSTSYVLGGTVIAPAGGCQEFIFIITPTYQATLQSNMPTIQAAFPNYTVVTYGVTISYGF